MFHFHAGIEFDVPNYASIVKVIEFQGLQQHIAGEEIHAGFRAAGQATIADDFSGVVAAA